MLTSFSVKRKLGSVFLLTTSAALLIACTIFAAHDYLTVKQGLGLRLQSSARLIGDAVADPLERGDQAAAARVLQALRRDAAVFEAVVHGADGKRFATLAPRSGDAATVAQVEDAELRFLQPIEVGGNLLGNVRITASDAEVYERFGFYAKMVGAIMLVSLACAALLSAHLQRMIYSPIESLSQVARRVKETRDYSLRAEVCYDDEIGHLAGMFNRMLDEVEHRDRQLGLVVEERTEELERRNDELRKEIAERTTAQSMLAQSEQRFKSAFESAAIGMILVHESRTMFQVNQAFCNMLGYSQGDMLGRNMREFTHPDDRDVGMYQYHELMAGEVDHYQIEKRYQHRDGYSIWALVFVSAVRDAQGRYQHAIAQVQDITEAHKLSQELSYQATHDSLTGLVNRPEFEARIKQALSNAQRIGDEHAVCYLDLDQFKVINDTCGHVAGDELLRQIAKVVRSKVRSRDTIARLGGDEFGILMEGCAIEQGKRVTETVRAAIEEFQFVWDDNRFRLGVSIGLVPINRDSSSVTEVLQHADAACFAAKDMGRNRVHVYIRGDQELAKRHGEMQWVTKIQQALEEDRFRLYIQPIVPVDVTEPAYDHYEVLIRMVEHDGSEAPPGAFLPAAERYNIAAQVDRWVFSHLLDWLAAEPSRGDCLGICSVNLSGLTLGDESFLDYVVSRLRSSPIASEKICFEITETAVIANLTQATHFITSLKQEGCLFALDDFGSGLSSFAYLKNLPVVFLKIDGMFVRDIERDPIDRALVRSINDVGKVMGKRTIAEFVENDAILKPLQELGVDYAQGYGISKPFPLDQFAPGARLRVVVNA